MARSSSHSSTDWGFTILNIVSAALVLGTLTVTLLRRLLRASLSTTETKRPAEQPNSALQSDNWSTSVT